MKNPRWKGGMSLPTRPDRYMNAAHDTAESSAHAMPTGSNDAKSTSEESRPLASTVPAMMTAAAATWAAWGGLRVATTWMTMPIHVNWNRSVMATATGSLESAML